MKKNSYGQNVVIYVFIFMTKYHDFHPFGLVGQGGQGHQGLKSLKSLFESKKALKPFFNHPWNNVQNRFSAMHDKHY